ncbi:MAG: hypothetical protein PHC88_02850 [Terrimicrobiaceae bacterium]|nr:hypothetical protein [Terrimicrobiaceae bacterium]
MPTVAEAPPPLSPFDQIRAGLRDLYLSDPRPWIVGFSGGKDSTMVASVVFEVVAGIPDELRTKPIAVLSTNAPPSNTV